ncbi:MAG: DNA polymerase III subunit delta, partial [Phycisphaerales bacterium]|nr:DNA polymerase III subunit delta [Phycisphaerales bacterium]
MAANARDPLSGAQGGAFYLHGEDQFRKEEALQRLVTSHLDPATRDFNFDPLRGTEVDPETLASVLGTPPMMAEWRVVVIREVEGLAGSKRARDILMDVVSRPPPGLALVLSCTVPDGSKAKFYGDLTKQARSVEFRAVADSDVPGWIIDRGRTAHDLDVEIEAAQALAGAIGHDLGVLARELEKLSDFVGDRRTVTLADVDAAGTKIPTQDRWRWFDLVGDRRFGEAHRTLEILFSQGESAVGLVMGLATQFLRLGVAAEQGAQALEASLPPHQRWLARRIVTQ